MNKAILMGNTTKDIELKQTTNGKNVVSFWLATNKSYTDKDWNKQDRVEFHNIVCYGKTAETLSKFVSKGSKILIEGELTTRNWEDQETGKKMYRTEIIVDKFEFCGKKSDNNTQKQEWNNTGEISVEDIPF